MLGKPEKSTGAAPLRTWGQIACLGAMNLYLVSPVLLYELGLSSARGGGIDKITLFALPASILWLIVLQLAVRPSIAHALLFPFYILVGADLFLILNYKTRLTSSTITVILENLGDTRDYIRDHHSRLFPTLALVLALYGLGMLGIRGLTLGATRRARLLAMGGLLVLYLAVSARQTVTQGVGAAALDVVSHDRNSPFGVLPQGFIAFRVYRQVLEHQWAARSFVFGARRENIPAEPELFVLVVGESSRPDHWGLYGYSRSTTPRLAAESNLVLFDDAVTQAALTQIAVPLIITRNTIDRIDQRENSVIALFQEIGFKTHWFSTQQRDQYTGAINRYSAEASDVRFLDRQYDNVLVDLLRGAASKSEFQGKHFVLLHTQGSHGVFVDRCPPEQRVFPVGTEVTERDRLINSYDNSIVYTDFVLSELIAFLKQRAGITALLYVADHGENLRDDARSLLGHFYNNEYDLPVPMLFWYSERFADRFPEKVAAVKRNATLRVSTNSIFYTLADLASVVLDDPRMSTSSLASLQYRTGPRRVFSRWDSIGPIESVDYDERFGKVVGPLRGVRPQRSAGPESGAGQPRPQPN
jgi:glucan phosphoethanolaminetransferase (alkaline phosphatase superfamily)